MAATAPATAPRTTTTTEDLLLHLGAEGEVLLNSLQGQFSEQLIALAWAKGEIEFGRTKYVQTGNVETAITVHNGVQGLPLPTLIVEGGLEWTGPKQRWHLPYAKLKDDKLPTSHRYEKYQLEVCVNKDKDVWEWLENGADPGRRETRYARREITRAEAALLMEFRVRLTDKGQAALTGN